MNNSRAGSILMAKNTEPIDYEFTVKVPTMTLSSSCEVSHKMKLRFHTQSNIHDVILEADEINPTPEIGTEIVFYSKVKIHTIMSFENKIPQEKIVTITLQDYSKKDPTDICQTKYNLAEAIIECMQDRISTVVEDLEFVKNMGLISIHITPKKLGLRDKVNISLSKPPAHTPISKMPTSPHKTPNRVFQDENNCEPDLFAQNNVREENSNDSKQDWNDVSFCRPEGECSEEEVNEGQCHYKTDRKKRSSSQITIKKPQGMGRIKPNNRPSEFIKRNEFDLSNKNDPLERKGGATIRSVIEESFGKISGSDTLSHAFDNSIFTTTKKKDKKQKGKNIKDRYIRNRNLDNGKKTPTDYLFQEPARNLYKDLNEADRINKLGCSASESCISASDHSMISSVSSVPNFCEKDIVKNDTEKLEFINKYQQAKEREKKYRKELKVLKLEKKQLLIKNEDVDQHLQDESHKIIEKAMVKIQDKIDKSGGKPKMNKLLSKVLIIPLLKLCMAEEDKTTMLADLIRNGQNDGTASALSLTPTKSVRSTKESGKSKNDIEKLQKKIKQLETENKALRFDATESSRLFEEQTSSLADERKKVKKVQKQLDSINQEDKKEKEGINSKISNYKTRIFFLESQVEELEKKNKQFETIRKQDKLQGKDQISKVIEEKEAVEKKLHNLREKFEDLLDNESSLKEEMKSKDDSISHLNIKIQDLETKLVELKTELADKMYELEMR
ncbi:unnamed protein product [Moneuplotes crassus]|uniref:C2 NT-type domain-containing protein n=1 Tax=Euplotes crassus TaxID=5936 RepID=A0AAD1YAI7_EUPCR|nr:unnamed protein product [Moneuplotes crassus]